MKIDYKKSLEILEEEFSHTNSIEMDGYWVELTKRISEECKTKNKTMIAMLGTALLAKATEISVDVFSLQVGEDKNSTTYSARALCKEVLAAHSKRLGIDLGVTGREPLNNQPFFGKARITEDFKVRSDAAEALNILQEALHALSLLSTERSAREALRSFIQVRKKKKQVITYSDLEGDQLGLDDLIKKINDFTSENSEGGKRAQAVSAGLLDTMYGSNLILSGRINDPSRNHPGDICIFYTNENKVIERVFEVKDKPITENDIQIFLDSLSSTDIQTASVIAVSSAQQIIDNSAATRWAESRGIKFKSYTNWDELIRECIFWSRYEGSSVGFAFRNIAKRCQETEISDDGISSWISY